jgi:hypothetical protein
MPLDSKHSPAVGEFRFGRDDAPREEYPAAGEDCLWEERRVASILGHAALCRDCVSSVNSHKRRDADH